MHPAIFGISDGPLNLIISLLVLFLLVVWFALIYWTYADARRRMQDPVLIATATAASLFPYLGTIVYTILRPPEYLEDAHERELEIRAAELRVRQLTEQACPNCEYPVERNYMRCPSCHVRLKDPCPSCSKPLDPRWSMCPYCESPVRGRDSRPARERRGAGREGRPSRERAAPRPQRKAPAPTARAQPARSTAAADKDTGSGKARPPARSGRRPSRQKKPPEDRPRPATAS